MYELEHKYKQGLSPSHLTEFTLNIARKELQELLSEKIEGNLQFVKHQYCKHGNRASRLLAFKLRKQQLSNTVNK